MGYLQYILHKMKWLLFEDLLKKTINTKMPYFFGSLLLHKWKINYFFYIFVQGKLDIFALIYAMRSFKCSWEIFYVLGIIICSSSRTQRRFIYLDFLLFCRVEVLMQIHHVTKQLFQSCSHLIFGQIIFCTVDKG